MTLKEKKKPKLWNLKRKKNTLNFFYYFQSFKHENFRTTASWTSFIKMMTSEKHLFHSYFLCLHWTINKSRFMPFTRDLYQKKTMCLYFFSLIAWIILGKINILHLSWINYIVVSNRLLYIISDFCYYVKNMIHCLIDR